MVSRDTLDTLYIEVYQKMFKLEDRYKFQNETLNVPEQPNSSENSITGENNALFVFSHIIQPIQDLGQIVIASTISE